MTAAAPVQITALYAGLAAVWLVFLGLRVIRLRYRYRVGIGAGGQGPLEVAQRTHANAAEWLPPALIVLLVLELLGMPAWVLHALGIALVAGRGLHALGLSWSTGVSWPRTVGMLLTITVVAGGGLLCVFYALTS